MTEEKQTEKAFDNEKVTSFAQVGLAMYELHGLGGEANADSFATLMAMMAIVADLQEAYNIPSEVIHTALNNAEAAKAVILKEVTKNV